MAIKTPDFRRAVGSVAMTSTYNTLVYDYFPLVPIHNRPIYWDARYSMEWASGKVSYEHNKLLSSGIGATVVEMVSKRILGGELVFKTGRNTKSAKETTDKIRKICEDKLNLNEKAESATLKFLAGGSSYFVLQPVGEDLRLDVLNIDQVAPSFSGDKITEAKIFINYYDNAVDGLYGGARYYLIEYRYYNQDNKPCSINRIYKSVLPQMQGGYETFDYSWRDNVDMIAKEFNIDLESEDPKLRLPENIERQIKADGIVLGVEVELPFKTLGIFHNKCSAHDTRHPNSKFGKPLLSGLFDLLWSYDFAFSILNKDLYVGRPITFLPITMNGNQMLSQHLGDGEVGNLYYQMRLEYAPVFDDEYVKVQHTSTEYQQPSTVQFDIRAEKLKTALDTIATLIAHNVGVSPTYLISVLNQQNETKTATEVASDMSETNLTIVNKRRLFQKSLNELIDQVAMFYGFNPDDVFVTFPPLEELNKTLVADYIVKLRGVDGMSDERLVELSCKEYSEAEKEQEIERIKELRKQKYELKFKEKEINENEIDSVKSNDRNKE